MEVLTVDPDGDGGSLPVFSFKEEAEMYLEIEISDGNWQIMESGSGELVSVLYEQCASVRNVALDPLPSTLADEMADLVSLDRERFVSRVVRREA